MLKFTIYDLGLSLKFVGSCKGLYIVRKRIPQFCRDIYKRVQPMVRGPRFMQGKNVVALKDVVNRVEAKHLLLDTLIETGSYKVKIAWSENLYHSTTCTVQCNLPQTCLSLHMSI